MPSAKPQSMAGQTEAPDDLIAELARLMADDARGGDAGKPAPAPVRIPGGEAPVSGQSAPPQPAAEARPSAPAIRIPGEEPPAASPGAEPFAFDFSLDSAGAPAGPVTPVPEREPAAPPVAPTEPAPLDHESIADLIAAELANDIAPEPEHEPQEVPFVAGPARGEDNFGVPPVFGLRSPEPAMPAPRPEAVEPQPTAPEPVAPAEPAQAMAPSGQADALGDIERLVGPAVHLNKPAPPSPALRSLATPTIPVAAAPASAQVPVSEVKAEAATVDDAILAAAAATGARVEWVHEDDAPLGHASEHVPEMERAVPLRERRGPLLGMPRAVAGPVVAVCLLAVAGFGLYWVLGQGGAPAGPAPLLVADTTPIKDVPEPDASAAAPESVVFNEISGTNTGADEQIVSRDQADADTVAEVNSAAGSGVLAGNDGTAVDPNQEGLVNRRVRTVTVRPDGTIVSGDDSLAGSAMLPVDRPAVPDVPGADFSTPELIASTEAGEVTAVAPQAEATPAPTPAAPGAVVPVVDVAGAAIPGRSVTMPMSRPDDFAQAAAAALSAASAAAAAPAAPAPIATEPVAAAPAASVGGGAAYVQLASQRTEEAARQSAQAIATRYGVLFGGANLEIQRVDLGERGIYYRVLVPAASREGAANICTNIKAAGGDCLLL